MSVWLPLKFSEKTHRGLWVKTMQQEVETGGVGGGWGVDELLSLLEEWTKQNCLREQFSASMPKAIERHRTRVANEVAKLHLNMR